MTDCDKVTMRERLDLRTMWMLTGTAMRIAMGMGLHRGGSFEKHYTPFECEYRRRLWWQVAFLDTRVGELAGFGASSTAIESDSKSPGTFNDADIHPDMTELPEQRTGSSEMLFIACRMCFREYGRAKGLGPLFMGVSKFDMKLAERERRIKEMEQLFEQNIVRYCDPLESLHVLVSAMARTVIHRLRLKAYHPIHNQALGEELSRAEQDVCFHSAQKILEYDNFVQGAPHLQGFLWHVRAHYQWDALIYILSELKRRGHDPDTTTKAWKQVEANFQHHPEFITEMRKPLHTAVCNLCLKAWAAREAAQAAQAAANANATATTTHNSQLPTTPPFIDTLRDKHAKQKTPSPSPSLLPNGGVPLPLPLPLAPQINQPDFADFANASLDPTFFGSPEGGFGLMSMDWSLWNDALEYQDPAKMFSR